MGSPFVPGASERSNPSDYPKRLRESRAVLPLEASISWWTCKVVPTSMEATTLSDP